MRKATIRVFLWVVVILAVLFYDLSWGESASIRITTCVLSTEDTNVNNRGEMRYYVCSGDNHVAFILTADSTGEEHLRQLVGRTVDVQVEVVK